MVCKWHIASAEGREKVGNKSRKCFTKKGGGSLSWELRMSRIFPRSISRERVLNQAEGRMSEKHKNVLLVSCITVRPE